LNLDTSRQMRYVVLFEMVPTVNKFNQLEPVFLGIDAIEDFLWIRRIGIFSN